MHKRRTSGEVWHRPGGLGRSQHLGKTPKFEIQAQHLGMEHFGDTVYTNFPRLSTGSHPLKQDWWTIAFGLLRAFHSIIKKLYSALAKLEYNHNIRSDLHTVNGRRSKSMREDRWGSDQMQLPKDKISKYVPDTLYYSNNESKGTVEIGDHFRLM